jgi:hypothetical protein
MKGPTAVALLALTALQLVAGQVTPTSAGRQTPRVRTFVNGSYGSGDSGNLYDPGQLSTFVDPLQGVQGDVPEGYGNSNSSDNVPIDGWIEFGWQINILAANISLTSSLNITEVSTGYLIDWSESAATLTDSFTRGQAAIKLTSNSFQICTNIARISSKFF